MFRGASSKGAVILVMTLAVTKPIIAQGEHTTVRTGPERRAEALVEKAARLNDQPARYAEAAWLYRESAALRSPTDPRAIEALAKAAHLYGYANRFYDARRMMEQVAEHALAGGDVARASQATLDAAFFAAKQGKTVHVNRLGRAALRLIGSPGVDPAQKQLILARIKAAPAVAAIVAP